VIDTAGPAGSDSGQGSAAAILVGTIAGQDGHDSGPWHPERAERIAAVERGVAEAAVGEGMLRLEGRPATLDELARVHDRRYLDALAQLAGVGGGDLDPDTRMSPGSWATAQLAAGFGLTAIEALEAGRANAAFVAIRPPGHHATADPGHGLLPAEQRGRGRRRPGRPGRAGRHRRLGRPPRQRDPGHLLGRPAGAVRVHPRVAGSTPAPAGPPRPAGRARGSDGERAPAPGATGDVALAAVDEVVAPVVDRFDPTGC
jgi:hypothetical protein